MKIYCQNCSKEMVSYKPDNDLFGFYLNPEFRCLYKCNYCKLLFEEVEKNKYIEHGKLLND